MGIEIFYQNIYLKFLLGGIIAYLGTFLFYLKNAKKDYTEFEKGLYKKIADEYSNKTYTSNDTIEIIFKVDKISSKYRFIRNSFKLNLWGALIFIGACFLGFGLNVTKINDSLAILGIFAGGLYFLVSLIIIIVWHYLYEK